MHAEQAREWTKIRYTCQYHWKWVVFLIAVLSACLLPFGVWAAATLENPVPGSLKSGIGVISGWVCDAEELEISFDGGPRLFVPYGSERTDTAGVCGDTDNGFGLLWNYNELGDGPHIATLYVDGILTTQVNFSVRTLGTNFLRGVTGQGTITLSDGKAVNVQWEETTQGFTITGYTPSGTTGGPPPSTPPPTDPGGGGSSSEEQQLRGLIGTWHFTLDFSLTDPSIRPLTRSYTVESVHGTGSDVLAFGTDPTDRSTFGVILSPVVLEGREYRFFMIDVDEGQGDYFCSSYFFNKSGNRIEGYFALMNARGPDITQCDPNGIIALGTFTGTRR